jgi:hypothetical protein
LWASFALPFAAVLTGAEGAGGASGGAAAAAVGPPGVASTVEILGTTL